MPLRPCRGLPFQLGRHAEAAAAGMAASRGWGRLVQPAVLAGSLSYAVGSAAGLLLGHLLGVLMK